MDELARDYADSVHWIFIYNREPHPDDYPDHRAHRSVEQKFQHARDMRERHNTPRQILIDDLDGTVHREWGGLPNMTWIIDHTGHVAYKAGWTVASDIRQSLEDVVRVRELKRQAAESGTRTPPYYVETLSFRASRRPAIKPAETAVSVGDGS